VYDFFVFGYCASAIGKAFSPTGSEFAQLTLAFMTFGAGFLMRPLGAYIDSHCRSNGLMLTLALNGGWNDIDRRGSPAPINRAPSRGELIRLCRSALVRLHPAYVGANILCLHPPVLLDHTENHLSCAR
jgi:hypothetical protein